MALVIFFLWLLFHLYCCSFSCLLYLAILALAGSHSGVLYLSDLFHFYLLIFFLTTGTRFCSWFDVCLWFIATYFWLSYIYTTIPVWARIFSCLFLLKFNPQ